MFECYYLLCRLHYKEYLVHCINVNKLDPIAIYSTAKIQIMLSKEELPSIDKMNEETENKYRDRLIKVCIMYYVFQDGCQWAMNAHIF